MMDAVRVPWASQSDRPLPAWSTKSPPGSAGTRGEASTPVSITATVTPAPVANLWASATPRYVLLHGGSWNPDPGSVVGDAHKNALFGRLIRARHVGRQRARIDRRWRDGRCGRRGEQRQRHRDQKDTVHSQNTPFVEIHCDSLSCVATLGHLTDLCAF